MNAPAGLQAERTGLSWSRTALTAVVAALLVLRWGLVNGDPVLVAAGAALVVASAWIAGEARRRDRRVAEAVAASRTPVDRRATLAVTVVVAVAGVVVVTALL
jgi:uncharacterized membrane protein YidH (DUF202 family)